MSPSRHEQYLADMRAAFHQPKKNGDPKIAVFLTEF